VRVDRPLRPDAFRVRHADPTDVGVLAALAARTFVHAFAADNDPQNIERYVAESFSEARIAADVAAAGSTFLLAYDDALGTERPVGYSRLQAGSTTNGIAGRRPIELARIYVEPAMIGRGYGSALLRACIDEAAGGGFDVIWLGVWEHNHRARRFYERWGFRQVGRHAFVLGAEVQTDHVMARAIPRHDAAPVVDATTS
jgi:ribosomal protein S18 acetylase RimI-like enzyme